MGSQVSATAAPTAVLTAEVLGSAGAVPTVVLTVGRMAAPRVRLTAEPTGSRVCAMVA